MEEANQCKEEGIEAFKQQLYEEAIGKFGRAIELMGKEPEESEGKEAWRDLVASCHDGLAACYHDMTPKNWLSCIYHCTCTAAIQLKPNFAFAKALMRRAKCFRQLEQYDEALEDYFDLIATEDVHRLVPDLYPEMRKVLDEMVKPDYVKIVQQRAIQQRDGQPLKIAQSMVHPWQFEVSNVPWKYRLPEPEKKENTDTDPNKKKHTDTDPLLLRTAELEPDKEEQDDKTFRNGGLDAALVALKHCKYDEIAGLAEAVADDERREPVERAKAALLAARFLHYQGLKQQTEEMSDLFVELWEGLGDQQETNKDLHVAHIELQMALAITGADGMAIPLDGTIMDKLASLVIEARGVNPKNVDPLLLLGRIFMSSGYYKNARDTFQMVEKIDPGHPFIKYYKIYNNFLYAYSREDKDYEAMQEQFVKMEQAIYEKRPPVFALLWMADIAFKTPNINWVVDNNKLALKQLKRAIKFMPNCSQAIYLAGTVDKNGRILRGVEPFSQSLHQIEDAMRRALEADPNNWKPYWMLANVCVKRHEFYEANRLFNQALGLARTEEDLMMLFKGRRIAEVMCERKAQNKPLPRNDELPLL